MCAIAIAEVLPEIEARGFGLPSILDREAAAQRKPPERIIEVPER